MSMLYLGTGSLSLWLSFRYPVGSSSLATQRTLDQVTSCYGLLSLLDGLCKLCLLDLGPQTYSSQCTFLRISNHPGLSSCEQCCSTSLWDMLQLMYSTSMACMGHRTGCVLHRTLVITVCQTMIQEETERLNSKI